MKVAVERGAGLNAVGMVAWMVTLRTPEYPEGRQAILIANDITHQVNHGAKKMFTLPLRSVIRYFSFSQPFTP